MAKTYQEILTELNITQSTTIDDLIDLAEELGVVSQSELNKIRSVSVMPLPDVVKDKATELKQRMTYTVTDESKGAVSVINKRNVLLTELVSRMVDSIYTDNKIASIYALYHNLMEDGTDSVSLLPTLVLLQSLTVSGSITALNNIIASGDIKGNTLQYFDENSNDYVNVTALLQTLKNAVETLEGFNANSRLNSLESDNTTNKSDISDLKSDNTSNKSRLNDLESDNSSNKSRLTSLESDNTSNKGRLDDLEGDNSSNKDRLDNLEEADFQSQIDALNAGQNLADMVASKSALNSYSTTNLQDEDKIQVLVDESQGNASTVYSWDAETETFVYIGKYGQDGYTKTEANALLNAKANVSDVYSKSETYKASVIDTMLGNKANNWDVYAKTETYNKTAVDTLLGGKANTTDVYNKTETYTKTEANALLNDKADADSVYTKNDVYTKTEAYSKNEVNGIVDNLVDIGYEMPYQDMVDIFDEIYEDDPIVDYLDTLNGEVI